MSEDGHGWFWREGYKDAFGGKQAILPNETKSPLQRNDYFDGYMAGLEDRYPPEEEEESV